MDNNLKLTDGWEKFSDLNNSLNKKCDWLIIRNFENLNDSFLFSEGEDIDILCSNIDLLVDVMKARKREGGRCAYTVNINNQNVPLDIRYIGDKYFDPLWARDMLNNKKLYNGIPVLSDNDYFFSLLYHIKLQKYFVKDEYVPRLLKLAEKIDFNGLDPNFIYDDKICAEILNNFLEEKNYTYTYTDDARRNEKFLKKIIRKEIIDLSSNWRLLLKNLIHTISNKLLNKLRIK